VVGAGLDALGLIVDPAGTLVQYGIAWLIEHVKPLSQTLDWLAGDPGQIGGQAQTWRNIAKSLQLATENLNTEVMSGTGDWRGPAAEAYRAWATQQRTAIAGIAKAADTMATITEGAGFLIAAMRTMVRDAIATVVSRLVVYAVELIASAGTATPMVVEQVTVLIATWAARIARWLKALLTSLRQLMPIIRRLGELINDLRKILDRLHRGGPDGAPKDPHEPQKPTGTRPGDPDFDPAMHHGPLGADFKPGVSDPANELLAKERAIADRLAAEGEMVSQRPADHTVQHGKNPDAMVRKGPHDPGTITEFKTLDADVTNPSSAVKRDILVASKQIPEGGALVIDGRQIDLSEADARRGYARAAGQAAQHGQGLADTVRIILGDNRIITLP
jgi:hypothetical protein